MRSQIVWTIVALLLGVFVYRSEARLDRAIARSTQDIANVRDALTVLDERLAQNSHRVMMNQREVRELGENSRALDRTPRPPSEEPTNQQPRYDDIGSEDIHGGAPATKSTIEEVAPILDELEEKFDTEAIDASWSNAAKNTLQHFWLPKLPPGGKLDAVDCRSTACRIESTFESEPQMNEFVYAALSDPAQRAWNWGMTTGPVRQDPVTKRISMVTFLMRETVDESRTTEKGVVAVP
jgi:hypothetical protein